MLIEASATKTLKNTEDMSSYLSSLQITCVSPPVVFFSNCDINEAVYALTTPSDRPVALLANMKPQYLHEIEDSEDSLGNFTFSDGGKVARSTYY